MPWVLVGGHYVVPIPYDGSAFSALQPYAVFRLDHGAGAPEDQNSTLARRLDPASRAAGMSEPDT